jgi:streptomycin 6-kinase
VARLHTAGPPPRSFIHVRDFAPGWEIPDGEEEVLTHLDLHAGNALRTSDDWKAIDPKGVRADRHADVWALIDPLTLEAFPRDQGQAKATAARWLERYAEAAEMDLAKAREWTRIRAGAEAKEVGDDSAWAAALRRMADALD